MSKKLTIQLSDWKHIDDLHDLEGAGQRGVYLLAHSEKKLKGMPDPYSESVVYIGETHGEGQSFKRRLRTFVRAAEIGDGVHNHSGGNNFYDRDELNISNVYVSICPCEGHHLSLIDTIKILKRGFIVGYQKKHNKKPVCNKR